MKIIGHRGAAGLAPENTLAALRKGLAHGVDRLEFDLRVTKDGIPILHHDPELTDPGGDKHLIAEHSFAELKRHKPDLATLQEALSVVGNTPVFMEVKPGVPLAPALQSMQKAYKVFPADLWLGSFSQPILLELQRVLPQIPKVVIEKWSGVRATRRARQLDTKLIAMNQRWLWWGFIRSMKRGGYELYAYPLNDPRKARRWARHGLAGVITDYPDRFER